MRGVMVSGRIACSNGGVARRTDWAALLLALLLALLAPACAPAGSQARSAGQAPAGVAAAESPAARTALYEVFVRDFSPAGTFQGVREGLDRIQAAGANVLWLMPVHPVGLLKRKEPLGSSYSLSDYRALNPDYGTAADFRSLVDAVHARGMRLIIDWVPNHTAWDHVWVRQHPEFYTRDSIGAMSVPRNNEGQLTDWTDVADLDYGNRALWREMIAAMSSGWTSSRLTASGWTWPAWCPTTSGGRPSRGCARAGTSCYWRSGAS
jgi:glycosidase